MSQTFEATGMFLFVLPSSKGLRSAKTVDEDVQISDRVLVAGKKTGVVKFIGETDFASGNYCTLYL